MARTSPDHALSIFVESEVIFLRDFVLHVAGILSESIINGFGLLFQNSNDSKLSFMEVILKSWQVVKIKCFSKRLFFLNQIINVSVLFFFRGQKFGRHFFNKGC